MYDGDVTDGVIVGEIMLFILCIPIPIPMVGLACCLLPIPGLLGAIAGNELNVLSGVIALLFPCGAVRFVGGGDIGGVDHEKAGVAGEGLFDDIVRFATGREDSIVDEVADGAFAQASPLNISVPFELFWLPPRTNASKSVSPLPFAASSPLGPPKLMNSFRDVVTEVALLEPSSCSFRVCSLSMRDESDFIRVMYA